MNDLAGHPVIVGLSHRTAPIEQRERAALSGAAARSVARALRGDRALSECAVLSTCNRTELLAVAVDPRQAEAALNRVLLEHSRIGRDALARVRYVHRDEDALRHLLRVAASLDSMVVGESEIQGQVRAAVGLGREEGTIGPVLARAFRHALAAGRRVRRETRIAAGAVSVSSVAADLALATLGDLDGRRGLLVGAGRTAEATARALVGRGLGGVVVANRTADSATRLAARFGGRAVGLDAVPRELGAADVLISSTDAHAPVLRPHDVAPAAGARQLVLIDIGVPRDVDPRVGRIPGVRLHNIDDLERVAAANLNGRRLEARRAEAIVEDELRRLAGHASYRRARNRRPRLEQSAEAWIRTASDGSG